MSDGGMADGGWRWIVMDDRRLKLRMEIVIGNNIVDEMKDEWTGMD